MNNLFLFLILMGPVTNDQLSRQQLADSGFFMGEFEEGPDPVEPEPPQVGCFTASVAADKYAMFFFILSAFFIARTSSIRIGIKNEGD